VLDYPSGARLIGLGNFRLEFVIYRWMGMDLEQCSDATLKTLELPVKTVAPFLVMILVSLGSRPNRKQALDRYYVKMRVPVASDPEQDRQQLQQAYATPEASEGKKLFPGSSLEFQKPSLTDALGFVCCFGICFLIIGIAFWVARIGG
jgi:hypothetical protein